MTAHVAFSDGLRLVTGLLPAGCGPESNPVQWNESDVACNAGHLNPGQSKTFSLRADALPTGTVDQYVDVFVDSTSPWASIGEDHFGVTVLIPEVPGSFESRLSGPVELGVGDASEVSFTSHWVGLEGQPAEGVLVRVNFHDSLEVVPIELDGLEPLEDSADPNDYGLLAASWPSSNEDQVAARWTVTPTATGAFTSESVVSVGAPGVPPEFSDWEVSVT